MTKITANIQITYDVDEADYPDGMDEDDIREETGMLREAVKSLIWRERLDATIDDITVKPAEVRRFV
jgi:hypothetical protein